MSSRRAITRTATIAIVAAIIVIAAVAGALTYVTSLQPTTVTTTVSKTTSTTATTTLTTTTATTATTTSTTTATSTSTTTATTTKPTTATTTVTSSTVTTTTAPTTVTTTATTTIIPTSTTTKRTVPNPDTITFENIGGPEYLDPAVDWETGGGEIIQNVYESLVFWKGETTDVIPWLAESYQVSPDGLTYTFKLRQGLKFHDGTTIDAEAVKFSFDRSVLIDDPNSATGSFFSTSFAPIRGEPQYSINFCAEDCEGRQYSQDAVDAYLAAKGVEVIDQYTVAIHLEAPYSGFDKILAGPWGSIVSPEAVKKAWEEPTDPNVGKIPGVTAGEHHTAFDDGKVDAGSGPYILASYDKSTETTVLKAFDNYWGGPDGKNRAKVPNVIIKVIADANTRLLDLKAGTADIIYVPTTHIFNVVDSNAWLNDKKVVSIIPGVVIPGPYTSLDTNTIQFNLAVKNPDGTLAEYQPFQDIRMRKAFSYAFDVDSYIRNVIQGFGQKAQQIVPPGIFGYDPSLVAPYSYNLTTAKEFLDAYAKDNGISPDNPRLITISYNVGNVGREVAAVMLANAINNMNTGIMVEVQPLAWSQYTYQRDHGILQLYIIGWLVDFPDADDFLQPFVVSTGTFASSTGYSNPKVDELYFQQKVETDPQKRAQIIKELQLLVYEDWIYIFRHHTLTYGQNLEVMQDWIHGFYYNPAYPGLYFASMSKG